MLKFLSLSVSQTIKAKNTANIITNKDTRNFIL